MQHQLRSILSLTLMIAALAGCTATTNPQSSGPPLTWAQRHTQVAHLSSWQLEGAFGITRNNTQSWSTSINWQQLNAADYIISLSGPLGIGAMTLQNTDGRVALVTDKHPEPITSYDAQELVEEQTGWDLPINNLYYWVRGIPAPGYTKHLTFDNQNHLTGFEEAGWQVQYFDYSPVNGIDLPHKLLFNNEDFSIKLVIQWDGIARGAMATQ